MAHSAVIVAGATRPCKGETTNGDAWQVDWRAETCRIAVIDALGHGPQAAEVAGHARRALAATQSFTPADSLRACQGALAGGRGAAISIISIDPASNELVFAGIGNVEAIFWAEGREQRLSPDRGIVGSAYRTLHPQSITIPGSWLLLVYTDGVRARFRLDDLLGAPPFHPETLATTVLAEWSRQQDDATVVVACSTNVTLRHAGQQN
jgi:hypothetical protein